MNITATVKKVEDFILKGRRVTINRIMHETSLRYGTMAVYRILFTMNCRCRRCQHAGFRTY